MRASESMDSPEYACFEKGLKVEVCFDDLDFRGSWHTGTILETPAKGARNIFIEFDELTEENDPKKLLREHVNFLLVRPICPREPTNLSSFKVDDSVDAFHRAGWWEGTIVRIHSRSGSNRYTVYFRSTRERITFSASGLRLHREWVRGEWVPPLPEPVPSDESE